PDRPRRWLRSCRDARLSGECVTSVILPWPASAQAAGPLPCTLRPPAPRGRARGRGRPMKETTVSQSRLLVLVSGTGSILQALLDSCASPAFGARVVAV